MQRMPYGMALGHAERLDGLPLVGWLVGVAEDLHQGSVCFDMKGFSGHGSSSHSHCARPPLSQGKYADSRI